MCALTQLCTHGCLGAGELTLDSVVLCPCGIGTAVPESWKPEATTCPPHLHTLLGTLAVYVEPYRGGPAPVAPLLLLIETCSCPVLASLAHWCQNNNKTPKTKPLLHTALILTLFPLEMVSLTQKNGHT